MRNLFIIFFLFFLLIFQIYSCWNSVDSGLEKPNGTGLLKKGTYLTPLGCIVYRPWKYFLRNDSLCNLKLYLDTKELYSRPIRYNSTQLELVFKAEKDKTLKYWFKKDNINSQVDATTNNETVVNIDKSTDYSTIRNVYTGSWTANFDDSTLKINFNDSRMTLPSFDGKFIDLGASSMALQQTLYFDSIKDNKLIKFKKVITTYLEH